MRAKLANLSDCAVPFLSRAPNLCWYDIIYTIIYYDKCILYTYQSI